MKWLIVSGLVLALAIPALADWDPSQPYKWVQMPDLSPSGVDVNTSYPYYLLADDFLCTQTGPITDIHIWGSWYHDYLPLEVDPNQVTFTLSIHADIPAGESGTGYSMPGAVLWTRTFQPGEFASQIWEEGIDEGWLEPPDIYEFPGDHVCWQYNFFIDEADAFFQEGTEQNPVVYWLDVQAQPLDANAWFGWKSSTDHWNDDAVWGYGPEPYLGPWYELIYPLGHPFGGDSIDLAFVITGTEEEPPYNTKWLQEPDLSPTGMDVNTCDPYYLLADDFLCTQTGPITDVHIWGSWYHDYLPYEVDPSQVRFTLSIHADIPAGEAGPYSMPGDVLWTRTFEPADFEALVWAEDIDEGWLEPPDVYEFPGDHVCWQYNFYIDEADAFFQEGTEQNPVVYWLDVQAQPLDGSAWFGWKTSLSHWNDDAVWGYGPEPYYGPWFELIYPANHELAGQSIDLAFAITGTEEPVGTKWQQDPDLDDTGMDVDATDPLILADDFECRDPGRLTEIYVWGSWWNDELPFQDPSAVSFTLSIHADIPAWESPTGYSIPGEVLWHQEFAPGGFTAQVWQDMLTEGWLDPPNGWLFPGDTICWLYTFLIPPEVAFHQSGTPDEPIVYWLDVQAHPFEDGKRFGWKTAVDHWNDDAVYTFGTEPYMGDWGELRYPGGHPWEGQSIDLAFALSSTYGTGVEPGEVPDRFGLEQNMPNPFNPKTTIAYDVPAGGGRVSVEVFDVSGRLVRTLVDGFEDEGRREVVWDGRDDDGHELASGVYFYRLITPETEMTRKMLLLK